MSLHRNVVPLLVSLLVSLVSVSSAQAWDPFLSPNRNVESGNRAMSEGDHQGALSAYDRAARELPNEAGVQLNRGLALLEQGRLDESREALLRASEPGGDDALRADAYYDLGLAFYRQGDGAADQEDHQQAQGQFREAADAFRRSLRARPGNRDAAWNLELALRRIREQEEAQQEQEEQEQEEQEQEDQEQQEGDEEQEDDEQEQNQDQQEGDEQEEESEQQEGGDEEDEQEGQDQQDQQGDESSDEEQESEDSQHDEPEQPEGDTESQGQDESQDAESGGQELPQDVSRVLDALRDSEESLERHRARARGRRENRRVTMDW